PRQGARSLLDLVGRLGHPGLGQVGGGFDPLQLLFKVASLVGDLLLLLGDGPAVEFLRLAFATFALVALTVALGVALRSLALRPILALVTFALRSLLALRPFLGLVFLLGILGLGCLLLDVLGFG